MAVKKEDIALIQPENNYEKDAMKCLIHFFAQNFRKKQVNKEVYEKVYNLYNQKYYGGSATDRRARFEHDINFIAGANPQELEKLLTPIFTELFEVSQKRSPGISREQAIVNFIGSLGYELEVFFEADLANPAPIYSNPMKPLKKPVLPAAAPKFRIICRGNLFSAMMSGPKIGGFQALVKDKNDREHLEKHNGIMRGIIRPDSVAAIFHKPSAKGVASPSMAADKDKPKPLGDAKPRPMKPAPLAPAPIVSPPKPANHSSLKDANAASPFDALTQGLTNAKEVFNQGQGSGKGFFGILGKIVDFGLGLLKGFSAVGNKIPGFAAAASTLLGPLLSIFGIKLPGLDNGSSSMFGDPALQATQAAAPNAAGSMSPFQPPVIDPSLVKRASRLHDDYDPYADADADADAGADLGLASDLEADDHLREDGEEDIARVSMDEEEVSRRRRPRRL